MVHEIETIFIRHMSQTRNDPDIDRKAERFRHALIQFVESARQQEPMAVELIDQCVSKDTLVALMSDVLRFIFGTDMSLSCKYTAIHLTFRINRQIVWRLGIRRHCVMLEPVENTRCI